MTGASAVLKRDGYKLRRLITAAPRDNLRSDAMNRGDDGLSGGGALALMKAPGMEVQMARRDGSRAFSSASLPERAWHWTGTPAMPAVLVWDMLSDSLRQELQEWSLICPRYVRLPMGLPRAARNLTSISVETVGRILASTAWQEIQML